MAKKGIHVYSGGSGCLHFVRQDAEGKARGSVSHSNARRWLQTREGQRLTGEGWELTTDIVTSWGNPCLMKQVERTGPDTLRVDGHIYTYSLDHANISPSGEIHDPAMSVTFIDPTGEKREMRNWSIRMVLRYFLNYERVKASTRSRFQYDNPKKALPEWRYASKVLKWDWSVTFGRPTALVYFTDDGENPAKEQWSYPEVETAWPEAVLMRQQMTGNNPQLCPICGEKITLTGNTTDGRLIGSCGDAFSVDRWVND